MIILFNYLDYFVKHCSVRTAIQQQKQQKSIQMLSIENYIISEIIISWALILISSVHLPCIFYKVLIFTLKCL